LTMSGSDDYITCSSIILFRIGVPSVISKNRE
jgi:hypothetical protein